MGVWTVSSPLAKIAIRPITVRSPVLTTTPRHVPTTKTQHRQTNNSIRQKLAVLVRHCDAQVISVVCYWTCWVKYSTIWPPQCHRYWNVQSTVDDYYLIVLFVNDSCKMLPFFVERRLTKSQCWRWCIDLDLQFSKSFHLFTKKNKDHHHHQFIYSTKQYKYSNKHWYKWSWNGNDLRIPKRNRIPAIYVSWRR